MNQIPNIEEELEETVEPDKVFDCFDEGCEECTVCKYLNFREWAEGCAPAGSSIERNQLVDDYLKRKHRQLQKAREEERERINQYFAAKADYDTDNDCVIITDKIYHRAFFPDGCGSDGKEGRNRCEDCYKYRTSVGTTARVERPMANANKQAVFYAERKRKRK